MEQGRYAAGIVNYGAYADLDHCLRSLRDQRCGPSRVVVVDHDPDWQQHAALRRAHPEVAWKPGANRGFAAGANRALRVASALDPEAEFLLLLNPDVRLESGFAAAIVTAMRRHPRAALASGKLLRPDGCTIDSTGIVMARTRRACDRASGQPDRGLYERLELVFGASGAALMLRRAALRDLTFGGEVFDEDFFAYHEDTDLAWRAARLGWSTLYVPKARAQHRRGWRREGWRDVPAPVRRHAFKNRYLEIIKNERAGAFLRDLPLILAWECLRLGHALLRDPQRLAGYADAARLAPRAWRKRRQIQSRVRSRAAQAERRLTLGWLEDPEVRIA